MIPEFVEFNKIARLNRSAIITEKIDGTNGCLFIGYDGTFMPGSRSKWLTDDGPDNFGFRAWCKANKDELMTLGPGLHFGEWWGSGIQRGYGLTGGEKRWSLFNVTRWCLSSQTPEIIQSNNPVAPPKYQDVLPALVGLVPVLYRGGFVDAVGHVQDVLLNLQDEGSRAAAGFAKPEGVVLFHVAANMSLKWTLDGDGAKGPR